MYFVKNLAKNIYCMYSYAALALKGNLLFLYSNIADKPRLRKADWLMYYYGFKARLE